RRVLWDELVPFVKSAGIERAEPLVEQFRMIWSGAVMVAYINREEFKPELFSAAVKALIDSELQKAGQHP
ncbi:MAG: hypothetical protein J7559_05395, partial [Cohnella sp.]|nr:hypothetical protein [Cohnella sp.]